MCHWVVTQPHCILLVVTKTGRGEAIVFVPSSGDLAT